MRLVPEKDRPRIREEASELVAVPVSEELRKDLECIANGIFSPLVSPLRWDDYLSVLERGRLRGGLP